MAEESFQERTEEATPKRREDFAKRGQVPRSRELSAFVTMLCGSVALMLLGYSIGVDLLAVMREVYDFDVQRLIHDDVLPRALQEGLWNFGLLMAAFLAVLVIAALVGPVMLGGWNFSGQALQWKGERVSPLQGIKRMVSARALAELVKAVLKVAVLGGATVLILAESRDFILGLGAEPVERALVDAFEFLALAFVLLVLPMGLIAAIDVPYQLLEHGRKLRMTRQEVREEFKSTEGRPEVKSRIRRLQQELATRRMMDAVPTADVVINNPTHFSVALRYDEQKMSAPVVVAKGVDLIAQRIRLVAEAEGVTQVQAPILARALFHNCEIDQVVPAQLYVAVAKVLAYVMQLKRGRAPSLAGVSAFDQDVPEDMRTESP